MVNGLHLYSTFIQSALQFLSLIHPFTHTFTHQREAAVEEAYERKSLKYAEIASQAEKCNWQTKVFPVEVGCRGFVAKTTTRLLKRMGVKGQAFRQAVKSLSEAAERSSNWLWIKRKDSSWASR